MSTQDVRSYIWDNVETLPPREMEKRPDETGARSILVMVIKRG